MTATLPCELQVRMRAPGDLRPDPGNARTHPKGQVAQIAASLREFGFVNPNPD